MSTESKGFRFSWFDHFCLWYPPGWLVLFQRHWRAYYPEKEGWNDLELLLFLVPFGFYLAFALRCLRLGFRRPIAEEHFDPEYQRAFRREVLEPMERVYFRAELPDAGRVPPVGPLLVVMNHAGMCFPWDFIGLLYLLSGVRDEPLRVVAHRSVFENRLVTWTFPPGWARTLGGVKATSEEFDVAFEHNPIVMIAPEGERGPNKGWHKRHRVMKFDPSFVKMSVKHSVPVLPIVCVGSESLTPLTYDLRALAEWCDLPFWAVSPWSLLSIPFPSMLM